ncbi:MAG: MFS transporter [Actinomycetota bacterium]|nr:MFS transporter [Actinomycetota bacterium]
MLGNYGGVFRPPGSAAFCVAGFIMRAPIAIYPIGLILIVSGRDGRYAFAGLLSACYVFAGGIGNPYLARLVDRYGQRRLIPPTSAAHLVAVVSLAVLFRTHAPDWALIPPTFVAGFAYLPVGSLVRSRWSLVMVGRPDLAAAYSVESTLDEVIFVLGPLIATLIATQVSPVLVLYVGAALVAAGSLWLTSLRGTEPPPHPVGDAPHRSVLRARGMVLLSISAAGMGALFASAEVSMVAFCGQHGHRGESGAVLACLASGSGIAGFVYGARRWGTPLVKRFWLQAAVFAVLPALLFAATSIPMLAVCAFVVGLGIAPTLITAFGLVEQLSPPGTLTEGLSWLGTGINVGYGAGAAVVGGIADAHGARVAFSVSVATALSVGLLATALRARLRVSQHESQPVGVA